MDFNRRLPVEAFGIAVLALAPVTLCGTLNEFIWWAEQCATLGLRPYPDVFFEVYPVWELATFPLIVAALVYALLVLLLTLMCWPTELTGAALEAWQMTKLRRAKRVVAVLLVAALVYNAYRWYPVWSQWL